MAAMVEKDVSYGSLQRDDQPAYPVDPASTGDCSYSGRGEPRPRLSQPRCAASANDWAPLHERPIERSIAADAAAPAPTPHWRTGCLRPSPGPPQSSDEPALACAEDLSQTLYVRIVRQWTETLADVFDWAEWPLHHFVFGDRFHEPLESQRDIDTAARVARWWLAD